MTVADFNPELNNWLINAFNGEWLRTSNAIPLQVDAPSKTKRKALDILVD